jgi:hypothetical protein
MMNIWTFLALAVLFGCGEEIYRARLKHKKELAQVNSRSDDLELRLRNIEDRLANVESICIEQDRVKQFDDKIVRMAVGEE